MLSVAADVVSRGDYRRRGGGSRRQALTWLSAGFRFGGKIVGVVLTGVVWIWIGFEASVDQGCGRVDVHFTNSSATWESRALAGLSTDVADGPCQERLHELRVVFVHDFTMNESQIFGLLSERGSHEAQL